MSPLGVGVIGVGAWGKNHVRVFSEMEEASMLAVVDRDKTRAKALAKKYNARYHTDTDELFRREDVDAVTICTPTVTHADLALEAIASGKHVLIEKPMTDTVQQAQRIIDASKNK